MDAQERDPEVAARGPGSAATKVAIALDRKDVEAAWERAKAA
jgi:hypothetical protein